MGGCDGRSQFIWWAMGCLDREVDLCLALVSVCNMYTTLTIDTLARIN